MTGRRQTLGLVVVCVLVLLSGCTGEQVWDLSVRGEGETVNESFVFDGRVVIGGKLGNTTVHNARVEFLTANRTVIKTVWVGDLSRAMHRKNLSVRLSQTPEYIRVVADSVTTHENAQYAFSGLQRIESGGYREYTQQTLTYNSKEGSRSVSAVQFRINDIING